VTDITRKRGDTYADRFTFTDTDTGGPFDFTGGSVLLTVSSVSAPTDQSTEVFQITGDIDADPTTGIVEFAPSALQADNVGYFFYDIQFTDGSGTIRTLVNGAYIMNQDITKD
jgi:hypothetical protein